MRWGSAIVSRGTCQTVLPAATSRAGHDVCHCNAFEVRVATRASRIAAYAFRSTNPTTPS